MTSKNFRKVKIVATLGPSSDSLETVLKLAEAGVDIFRLNLSHRAHEESVKSFENIRKAEKIIGRPLSVMGDLAGPKIRIGNVQSNAILETGQKIEIIASSHRSENSRALTLNFPEIIASIQKGAEIYLGDGDIKLEAIGKTENGIITKTISGGPLRDKMSFSVVGLSLKSFALSSKDKSDIKSMIGLGADALAVSFVQEKKDIESVLKLLPKENRPLIIAKIETKRGVENAESILEVSDGLMVARGDLGLSVPIAEVPNIQKELISLALKKSKPIITATQMLDSMTKNPLPTRAEVADVANAVLDGTDAVMLSGETALGKFPVESVCMMSQIISATSNQVGIRSYFANDNQANAIASSLVKIADEIGAKAIVVLTHSGRSARLISRHRPNQPIIALSPNENTLHRLNFVWGVQTRLITLTTTIDDSIQEAKTQALAHKNLHLKKGDRVAISAGFPFGKKALPI